MADWPVHRDGLEYDPIPASWIEHGSDRDHGSPRLYAVSVAHSARDMISIRYVARDGGVYVQTCASAPNPTGDGVVPASLATYRDWPRSLVPPRGMEPVDHAHTLECEHVSEIWSDVDDAPEESDLASDRHLAADGGSHSVWTPSDLGLEDDVPERFEDLEVHNSDLQIDVDDYEEDLGFDPRDPDDLADERESALESAHGLVEKVSSPGYCRTALDSVRLDMARNTTIGAMRAEYLRRHYAQTEQPAGGGSR